MSELIISDLIQGTRIGSGWMRLEGNTHEPLPTGYLVSRCQGKHTTGYLGWASVEFQKQDFLVRRIHHCKDSLARDHLHRVSWFKADSKVA